MKGTNLDPIGARAGRATRGLVSTNLAGGKGMVWRDGATESSGQIRDMTVVGATFTDNDDGTGVLTVGSSAGAPSSSTVGEFNVKSSTYGAVGDGTTDDTAAIQAAIDAAYAAGGGTIYFPPGLYIISGALQDTGARNGQLLLPTVTGSSAVDHIVITFKGALRPGFHPLYGDVVPLAAGLSVLKSTLTGATGTAACISGGNGSTGNNLEVNIVDLVCLGPDNPTFTFWNLSICQGGQVNGLQVSTPGAYSGSLVLPTNTNSYCIKLPQRLFANNIKVDGLATGGFYTGVLDGELTVYTGPLILGPTYYGIEFPMTDYPTLVAQLTATNVVRVLRGTGLHKVDILHYVRESPGTGDHATVYDLYDPSDYLSGYIRWYTRVGTTTGADDSFYRTGGTNVDDQAIGGAWGDGTQGAGQRILLADGHATPFTFNDLLQMDDGSDFLWND